MREEDLDWNIYHILAAREKCVVKDLIEICGGDASACIPDEVKSGLSEDELAQMKKEGVLKSLMRLEKNCLIEIGKDDDENGNPIVYAQVLSLQETIMRNQVRCAVSMQNSPVIVENGIIKTNPAYKRPE